MIDLTVHKYTISTVVGQDFDHTLTVDESPSAGTHLEMKILLGWVRPTIGNNNFWHGMHNHVIGGTKKMMA